MKSAFNPLGTDDLNKEERMQKREIRIEMEKVQRALQQQQTDRRPQDEYDERKRLLQEHPRPALKPDAVRTPRPDFDKLAKINVSAMYAREEKAALKPFEDKLAAIDAASRERQGLPPEPAKEEPAPARTQTGDERLEPEEITDGYVQHVEALTEQQNLQPGPSTAPDPLSWPEQRQAAIDDAKAEMSLSADRDRDLDPD